MTMLAKRNVLTGRSLSVLKGNFIHREVLPLMAYLAYFHLELWGWQHYACST